MPLKRLSVTPRSAISSFVIFAIARAPDGPAAGLPFEIGERGIGHKLRGIAGRYIDFSDDQIRRCLSKNIPSCSQGNQSAVGGSE